MACSVPSSGYKSVNVRLHRFCRFYPCYPFYPAVTPRAYTVNMDILPVEDEAASAHSLLRALESFEPGLLILNLTLLERT